MTQSLRRDLGQWSSTTLRLILVHKYRNIKTHWSTTLVVITDPCLVDCNLVWTQSPSYRCSRYRVILLSGRCGNHWHFINLPWLVKEPLEKVNHMVTMCLVVHGWFCFHSLACCDLCLLWSLLWVHIPFPKGPWRSAVEQTSMLTPAASSTDKNRDLQAV